LKEANESPKAALRFYEQVLEADPSNAVGYPPLCFNFHFTEKAVANLKAIWKRQISVLRKLGEIDRAVEELSKFVDTFYTDAEAWLELADIYTSQHQCATYSRQYIHSAY
jgi:tetratricopeptide (TPR) repeat protein